jgi:transposase-like protein
MDENKYSERRDYHQYPESLKLAIVREYESTKASKAYLKRKYGISTTNTIKYWLSKYGNNAYLSIAKNTSVMSSKTEDSSEVQKLKQRIHQLERELEDAKLLSEAYSLMIKKAEEELKIPIRKKYNTK